MPALASTQPFQLAVSVAFDTPYRVWDGDGRLTLDGGVTYYEPGTLDGNESDVSAEDPETRLTLTLPVIEPSDITRYLTADPGPLDVDFAMVWRETPTSAWQRAATVIGRTSAAYMQDGQIIVEVETATGDVDRGLARFWSDSSQKRLYPGDRGLEALTAIASQGLTLSWPP